MNVNNFKPTRHDKAMSMWRGGGGGGGGGGAGILMGNLVVINCNYGFFLFNNLSFLYNLFCFKIQISCN